MIAFQSIHIPLPAIDQESVRAWVKAVAATYNRQVGDITYIFVDDEEILDESTENSGDETGPDLPDKGNANNGEEEDLQTLYSRVSKERERQAILSHILEGVTNSISNRAKKRPDDLINSYKANKINALLIEIRVKYQNTGYEDLLELIQEPQEVEEDGRKYVIGMTYSDVEILLNHYSTVLRHIRIQE